MESYFYCPAAKLKQLQELVKQYNARWVFSPYPAHSGKPEGNWRVGIDFKQVDSEDIQAFQVSWDRLNSPVVESIRKPSLKARIRRFLAGFHTNNCAAR